jgi:cytochrome oxidase Cu insertion factor (SCO1/SenC/PrrC family)
MLLWKNGRPAVGGTTKMKIRMSLAIAALCVGGCLAASGQEPANKAPKKEPHRVLGQIPFSYSYPDTLKLANSNGKPILAYFTFDT